MRLWRRHVSTARAAARSSTRAEKEIVMIIVPTELRNDILHTVYQKVGLKTPGQGIAFSLPVEEVVGFGKEKQLTADGTEE